MNICFVLVWGRFCFIVLGMKPRGPDKGCRDKCFTTESHLWSQSLSHGGWSQHTKMFWLRSISPTSVTASENFMQAIEPYNLIKIPRHQLLLSVLVLFSLQFSYQGISTFLSSSAVQKMVTTPYSSISAYF